MPEKKKKAIIRFVPVMLFNSEVVLVRCEWDQFLSTSKEFIDEDKFKKLEKMATEHGDEPSTLATQFPLGGGGSIIWAKPDVTLSTVVHESIHAAIELLKKRAIPLSEDTEEVYAYLIEFLFKSFIDPVKK